MKNVSEQLRDVYNKLGKQYIKDSAHLDPIERAPFVKKFSKGANILDLGCGGGRDSKYFVSKGLSVTGIDISDVMIAEAKKSVPSAKFKQGNLLTMKFPKGHFDGVWAQAVLLHLKRSDVPKALKKIHKTLRPNGLLHLRVKKGKGEEYVKEKLSGWNERFYTYFSKKELKELLEKNGFKIIYSKIVPDQLKRKNVTWIALWARKI